MYHLQVQQFFFHFDFPFIDWFQGMTEQKNLFAISKGILHRNFAQEEMIRTAPNLNLQNAKREKHSENPNRNRTCIDSNISLNFEPNKQQNKY